MLRSVRQLRSCHLGAIDGELGRVVDVYFDDEVWAVRYLVADTRRWLPGRQVLISPSAIGDVDPEAHVLPVALTQEQVRNSPDVDSALPVSRQRERELATYYGWPLYWVPSPDAFGTAAASTIGGPQAAAATQAAPAETARTHDDPHLRSAREIIGYHIQARDGAMGHVADLLVDDWEWMVRYLILDTRNFWPGRNVLVSTQAVREMSWDEAKVAVDLTTDQLEHAPIYDAHQPVGREYEESLHDYYGWRRYWE